MASLFPREYGAYAELGFPLLTAFVAGGASLAAACFAAAVVAWFLVHEPVAVLRGVRGPRLRATLGAAARRRIVVLVLAGAASGLVALILAPPAARLAALVPALGGAALLPALLGGSAKSLVGELLVAAALASMLLPVGLAAGLPGTFVGPATGVWCAAFVLATVVVHAVKARHKPDGPQWSIALTVALALLVLAAGVAASVHDDVPLTMGLALLPTAVLVLVVVALAVHPRRLKRVGWSLVTAHVATLALLVAAG